MRVRVAIGWIAGILALGFLLSVVYLQLTEDRTPANARTVAQALEERASGEEQGSSFDESSSTALPSLRRLFKAIGLPDSSLDNYNLSQQSTSKETRRELIQSLGLAIDEGLISVNEANAVLKAFDLGLVKAPQNHILLEEKNSSHARITP